MVNPGEGLAENIMSSDRKSGEGTGDTSDEVDMLDMLDRLLVGPAGRLEKYVEGLNDRPRLAIFQNAPTRPLPGRIDPHCMYAISTNTLPDGQISQGLVATRMASWLVTSR